VAYGGVPSIGVEVDGLTGVTGQPPTIPRWTRSTENVSRLHPHVRCTMYSAECVK
jgi:hypothetical protein